MSGRRSSKRTTAQQPPADEPKASATDPGSGRRQQAPATAAAARSHGMNAAPLDDSHTAKSDSLPSRSHDDGTSSRSPRHQPPLSPAPTGGKSLAGQIVFARFDPYASKTSSPSSSQSSPASKQSPAASALGVQYWPAEVLAPTSDEIKQKFPRAEPDCVFFKFKHSSIKNIFYVKDPQEFKPFSTDQVEHFAQAFKTGAPRNSFLKACELGAKSSLGADSSEEDRDFRKDHLPARTTPGPSAAKQARSLSTSVAPPVPQTPSPGRARSASRSSAPTLSPELHSKQADTLKRSQSMEGTRELRPVASPSPLRSKRRAETPADDTGLPSDTPQPGTPQSRRERREGEGDKSPKSVERSQRTPNGPRVPNSHFASSEDEGSAPTRAASKNTAVTGTAEGDGAIGLPSRRQQRTRLVAADPFAPASPPQSPQQSLETTTARLLGLRPNAALSDKTSPTVEPRRINKEDPAVDMGEGTKSASATPELPLSKRKRLKFDPSADDDKDKDKDKDKMLQPLDSSLDMEALGSPPVSVDFRLPASVSASDGDGGFDSAMDEDEDEDLPSFKATLSQEKFRVADFVLMCISGFWIPGKIIELRGRESIVCEPLFEEIGVKNEYNVLSVRKVKPFNAESITYCRSASANKARFNELVNEATALILKRTASPRKPRTLEGPTSMEKIEELNLFGDYGDEDFDGFDTFPPSVHRPNPPPLVHEPSSPHAMDEGNASEDEPVDAAEQEKIKFYSDGLEALLTANLPFLQVYKRSVREAKERVVIGEVPEDVQEDIVRFLTKHEFSAKESWLVMPEVVTRVIMAKKGVSHKDAQSRMLAQEDIDHDELHRQILNLRKYG